jgi:hypothetical protein
VPAAMAGPVAWNLGDGVSQTALGKPAKAVGRPYAGDLKIFSAGQLRGQI